MPHIIMIIHGLFSGKLCQLVKAAPGCGAWWPDGPEAASLHPGCILVLLILSPTPWQDFKGLIGVGISRYGDTRQPGTREPAQYTSKDHHYRYKDSHWKDKMIVRLSLTHWSLGNMAMILKLVIFLLISKIDVLSISWEIERQTSLMISQHCFR